MAKTLKIVGLDGMKCQWVAEQDFLLIFGSIYRHLFFVLFSFSPTCLTESCSLGYCLKDFFSRTSCMSKLSITVKTNDVRSATRDPPRRLRAVHLSATQQVSCSAVTFSERWYRQGSHSTRWLFLPTRKDIWESMNSNNPGLEQVVYTHQTSCWSAWPRGLGELIPSHHS